MQLQLTDEEKKEALDANPDAVAKHGPDPTSWPDFEIRWALCRANGCRMIPLNPNDCDLTWYRRFADSCVRIGFLPTYVTGLTMVVAMKEPWNEASIIAIRQSTHLEVRPFGVTELDFDKAVTYLDNCPRLPAATKVTTGIRRPTAWTVKNKTPTEIAHEIIQTCFLLGASDILLDPEEGKLMVAIKRNGKKEVLAPINQSDQIAVITAFKELAGLSIRDSKEFQTGKIMAVLKNGQKAELRVEMTPCQRENKAMESIVMRLQDSEEQLSRMLKLPFAGRQEQIIRTLLSLKQGLMIVTGPTGSGKTSTIYACMSQLDRSALNVRTLEDPIEIELPWVTQISVGTNTGRTFAAGLKSLLRQAPDAILVGEIRDSEVAGIAVETVLTGHLVFGTLHTQDSIGIIPRLLDMGIPGSQIAATLTVGIAQRLLRRNCPHCRRELPLTARQREYFESKNMKPPEVSFVGTGCKKCDYQKVSGRVPVFELFRPGASEEIIDMLNQASKEKFNARDLRALWERHGGESFSKDGLQKVIDGSVSYEEVFSNDPNPPIG